MKRLLSVLLLLALLVASGRAAQLGDPAAPLVIAEWVKGGPIDLAAVKGRNIVVVEFWATWCGPCRVSIPHLTEMQKKFGERGVLFVGVSDETVADVKPFVDNLGDQMDYTVAVDKDGRTGEGYMKAFGVGGIPNAFIVDKEGRVAWQGHPMAGLDKALELLLANTFDLSLERKRNAARRQLEEYFKLASGEGIDAELDKLGAQLAALDKELGGIDPDGKLDLAGIRRNARFEIVMREYQSAVATGRGEAELAKIEARAVPLAPPGFKFAEFKGQFQMQRLFQDYYRALTRNGEETKAVELGRKLEGLESDNVEMLNEMAWTLLTDERIKTPNHALAMKFIRSALSASGGRDPTVLDIYARALFDSGKVTEAVRQQRHAIELCEDTEKKRELVETLKRYEGRGSKGGVKP